MLCLSGSKEVYLTKEKRDVLQYEFGGRVLPAGSRVLVPADRGPANSKCPRHRLRPKKPRGVSKGHSRCGNDRF